MEFWKEVRQRVLTGEMSQRVTLQQYHLGLRPPPLSTAVNMLAGAGFPDG